MGRSGQSRSGIPLLAQLQEHAQRAVTGVGIRVTQQLLQRATGRSRKTGRQRLERRTTDGRWRLGTQGRVAQRSLCGWFGEKLQGDQRAGADIQPLGWILVDGQQGGDRSGLRGHAQEGGAVRRILKA
jgi:hypothetical protein